MMNYNEKTVLGSVLWSFIDGSRPNYSREIWTTLKIKGSMIQRCFVLVTRCEMKGQVTKGVKISISGQTCKVAIRISPLQRPVPEAQGVHLILTKAWHWLPTSAVCHLVACWETNSSNSPPLKWSSSLIKCQVLDHFLVFHKFSWLTCYLNFKCK